MGRSIKKGPFVDGHLLEKIQKAKDTKSKTPIKTWSRRSMITPEFVGPHVQRAQRQGINPVFVTENMVGHRLGEFSLTRTFKKHGAHTAKAKRNSHMQVHAITKNIRMSAQKMREVVRQIQGLPALQAQAVLAVVPRKGARFVAKTLKSAIANAEDLKAQQGLHGVQDRRSARQGSGGRNGHDLEAFHSQGARFGRTDPEAQLPH